MNNQRLTTLPETVILITNNIVYGSALDDNMPQSWVTRQNEAEEWLGNVFGGEKKEELSKRLQQKLNSITFKEKQKNAYKFSEYAPEDFAVPYAVQYKTEHNIGAEDRELNTWGAVLDILQTGVDATGENPGIGTDLDLLNTAIYATRGDWVNAGLSAKRKKEALQKQKPQLAYSHNVHVKESMPDDTKELLLHEKQRKQGKETNEIFGQWHNNLQNTTKGSVPSLSYVNPLPKTMYIRPDKKGGNSMIMDIGPFKVEPKGNPIFKLDSPHVVDGKVKDTHINTLNAKQIEKSKYSPLQKKALGKLSHKEIPHWMYKAFHDFDDVAKNAKAGGKILGVLGTLADAYELGSTVHEDLHDEDEKLGKKTAKAAAGIGGGWAGSAGGAALGAKAGAALGTFIAPGAGTLVGGFLGGIAGGIGGAYGGDWLGKYAVEKLWKP